MIKKLLARYFISMANGYAQRGIFDRVLSLSNRAVALDPTYAEAYMFRGWARCGQFEQPEAGKADLDIAAKLKPGNKEILRYRADANSGLGFYTQAIEDANQILASKPDDVEVLMIRGTAYRRSKQYELALQDFGKALELQPRNAALVQIHAFVYEALGDYERAMTYYDVSLNMNPRHTYALYYRALLHKQMGNIEQANADYNRLIKLNRNYPQELFDGAIARSKQDPENAISSLNNLLVFCDDPVFENTIKEQLRLLTQQT